MDEISLMNCHSWFKEYARRFYSSDPEMQKNIRLKEEHTYRVCHNMARLATSLNSERLDLHLAKTIALFHDIGRFEQLKKFGTYDDRISEDHASLGLKVLKEFNVLSNLDQEEQAIVCKAILFHNQYCLPVKESMKCLMYSKLIKDADKIDILDIITIHFEERDLHPNSALDFGMQDSLEFSPEIIEDLLSSRMAKIGKLKTLNDMKLMYLSWVFDINFPFTLNLITEQGYVDRLIESLPDTKEIRKVRFSIKSYISNRQQYSKRQ